MRSVAFEVLADVIALCCVVRALHVIVHVQDAAVSVTRQDALAADEDIVRYADEIGRFVRMQLALRPVVIMLRDGVHHGKDEAVNGERDHLDLDAARLWEFSDAPTDWAREVPVTLLQAVDV